MGRGKALCLALTVVALVALVPDAAFAQCAMCRTALKSPEGQRMISALRSGILVLLAAPFAVFGIVATLAVRRFHSARSAIDGSTTDARCAGTASANGHARHDGKNLTAENAEIAE